MRNFPVFFLFVSLKKKRCQKRLILQCSENMFIFKYVFINTHTLSCLQKYLTAWFWVQGLIYKAAILSQKSMDNQATHICFVYFGHDVKTLKIACLDLGLCLVVKSYTVLFLLFVVCFWLFLGEVLKLRGGKLHQIQGSLDKVIIISKINYSLRNTANYWKRVGNLSFLVCWKENWNL
jgi:hypothetical protein